MRGPEVIGDMVTQEKNHGNHQHPHQRAMHASTRSLVTGETGMYRHHHFSDAWKTCLMTYTGLRLDSV